MKMSTIATFRQLSEITIPLIFVISSINIYPIKLTFYYIIGNIPWHEIFPMFVNCVQLDVKWL